MTDSKTTEHASDGRIKLLMDEQHRMKILRQQLEKYHKKKIYIISGDLGMRETLKGNLKSLNFPIKNVTVTNNSAKIVQELASSVANVDLVICRLHALDISYSDQTGIQLLTHIKSILRKTGTEKKIPFIVMEKTFNKQEIKGAFQAGASQFIIFPSSPLVLGEKLLEVFDREKESPINKEVQQLLLAGNKFQEKGLFEDAIYCYNKALEIGGEDINVMNEKANVLVEMGEFEEAISIYKHIIRLEENFPRAYQGLETAYSQLGNVSEAKKYCLKVLELEPDNVQIHYDLGVLYMDEGNHDSARKCFETGIKSNDMFFKNYIGLAKNYDLQGNVVEALGVYKEAIDKNPKQIFLYITAGDFCLRNELFSDADQIFEQSINLNESNLHLYNRRGIALRKQHKYQEAIKNYEKALTINPNDPALYFNIAKSHYLAGNEKTCIERLQKAFDLNPVLDFRLKIEEDANFSKLLQRYPNGLNFRGLKKDETR